MSEDKLIELCKDQRLQEALRNIYSKHLDKHGRYTTVATMAPCTGFYNNIDYVTWYPCDNITIIPTLEQVGNLIRAEGYDYDMGFRQRWEKGAQYFCTLAYYTNTTIGKRRIIFSGNFPSNSNLKSAVKALYAIWDNKEGI
jgi:hypothetical protein